MGDDRQPVLSPKAANPRPTIATPEPMAIQAGPFMKSVGRKPAPWRANTRPMSRIRTPGIRRMGRMDASTPPTLKNVFIVGAWQARRRL